MGPPAMATSKPRKCRKASPPEPQVPAAPRKWFLVDEGLMTPDGQLTEKANDLIAQDAPIQWDWGMRKQWP
jgi:hypothetical protein